MSDAFFVRHLGKVRGPFAPEHVTRLVAVGLFGPTAEVSTDRAGWCPLAAHPGFGGSADAAPVPAYRPAPARTVAAPPVAADNFELDLSMLLPPDIPLETGNGSEWFDNVELGAIEE